MGVTRGNSASRLMAVLSALGAMLVSLLIAGPADASVTGGGYLYNVGSGLCLGIRASSASSGAYAVQGLCQDTPTQTWRIRASIVGSDGAIAYQYENGENWCLGVQGSSQSAGAQVLQGACSGTSDHSQFWSVYSYGNVYYLKNFHSGMCLGIAGNSTAGGANVLQLGCDVANVPTQRWL